MGGSDSKQKKIIMTIIQEHPFQNQKNISQKEFTSQIFKKLNNNREHSEATHIVSDTHVLKTFYKFLVTKVPSFLPKSKQVSKEFLIEKIEKAYKKPDKAMQYSYYMIQNNYNEHLEKKNFVNYMKKCYDSGIQNISAMGVSKDKERFKKSLKEWLSTNDDLIVKEIHHIFDANAQVNTEFWTFGDFKRWILSKENWFIYIELNDEKHRIPLHLLCILGIENYQKS